MVVRMRPSRRMKWSAGAFNKRGRSFPGVLQWVIHALVLAFRAERDQGQLLVELPRVGERVARYLDISRTSVTKYFIKGQKGGCFQRPGKSRPRASPKRNGDQAVKNEIRALIYAYANEGKVLTLDSLLKLIRSRNIKFQGGRSTLSQLLKDIGFSYVHRTAQPYVIQNEYIAQMRRSFLANMMTSFMSNRRRIYLDETWTFTAGTGNAKEWRDDDRRSCSTRKMGKGNRFIILHAGGQEGFVPGVGLFTKSTGKPKPGDDYHRDMDGNVFGDWFLNTLLPELDKGEPCDVIMDNASYHSVQSEKQPTCSWKKPQLKEWLTARHINFSPHLTKKELLQVCQKFREPKKYKLDVHIKETTKHRIIRLPPYHPIYNPIELIWGIGKRKYDKKIGAGHKFTTTESKKVWETSLGEINAEMWANCCRKIENRIREDFDKEFNGKPDPCVTFDEEMSISPELEDILKMVEKSLSVETEDIPPEEKSCGPASMKMEDHQGRGADKEEMKVALDPFPDVPQVEMDAAIASIMDDTSHREESQPIDTEELPWDMEEELKEEMPTDLNDHVNIDNNECQVASNELKGEMNESPKEHEDDNQRAKVKTLLQQPADTLIPIKSNSRVEEVRVRDLKTLEDHKWLNDVIINVYLQLISNNSNGHVHAMSTHFLKALPRGYDAVKKWIKPNLSKLDLLLIPCHANNHWTLFVVKMHQFRVCYYDSMAADVPVGITNIIIEYLRRECPTATEEMPTGALWEPHKVKEAAEQNNGFDCGVFVCEYAARVAQHDDANVKASDVAAIRRRVMQEIVEWKLKNPPAKARQSTNKCTTPVISRRMATLLQLSTPVSRNVRQSARQIVTENPSPATPTKKMVAVPSPTPMSSSGETSMSGSCGKKRQHEPEEPKPKRKRIEAPTGIRGAWLHKSSQYHQGTSPIQPRKCRGFQCTGIAVYAIVALLEHNGEVTQKTLDDILKYGDKYYYDSKTQNKVQANFLAPGDLLQKLEINQQVFKIKLDPCMDGEFAWSNKIQRLANRLEEDYKQMKPSELIKSGFLFVGGDVTFSGFVKASPDSLGTLDFYLFNSHSVNIQNKAVNHSSGKARLFRCTNANALSALLFTYLKDKTGNFFQVWYVTYEKKEN